MRNTTESLSEGAFWLMQLRFKALGLGFKAVGFSDEGLGFSVHMANQHERACGNDWQMLKETLMQSMLVRN